MPAHFGKQEIVLTTDITHRLPEISADYTGAHSNVTVHAKFGEICDTTNFRVR